MQKGDIKQTAAATPTAPAGASAAVAVLPERKIVFAANATVEEKRRAVARSLAARRGNVGAAYDCAQWYGFEAADQSVEPGRARHGPSARAVAPN
jgi:hypothetical protein